MKITFQENPPRNRFFGDLRVGNFFILDGELFFKWDPNKAVRFAPGDCVGAIRVAIECMIIPVEIVEVIIKEYYS